MGKLLVAGLDGATWDILGPWSDSGKLDYFNRLKSEGAWGRLTSVRPNLTPPGWTSAFTGTNPGKHGIFDFFALDPGSEQMRVVTSADRKAPAIWEILSSKGLRVGVFNVPFTYPADASPAFMICGMGTPGFADGWASPKGAGEIVRKEFPGFRFGVKLENLERGNYRGFLEDLYAVTATQEAVAIRLLKEYSPDVFIFVYDDLDRLMHFFWHFMDASHPAHVEVEGGLRDAISDYYRRIGEGIDRLRGALGPGADLCVLSDHGFGPLHKDVYLNRCLCEWGYLGVVPAAAELERKPAWKRGLKRVIPKGARAWLRRNVKASPLANPLGFIDWKSTRAFYSSVSGRSVFVNLRGRQPRGTVEPGAGYEALRSEIAAKLAALRDPETGSHVAEKVFRREEVYSGPLLESAPDLVIQEDGRYAYRVDWGAGTFAEATQYGIRKTGSHRPDGILLLHGPSFSGGEIRGAKIEDVTPTLLAALGLPMGEHMDGDVLAEALKEGHSRRVEAYEGLHGQGGPGLTGGEQAAVEERLRGLGYL